MTVDIRKGEGSVSLKIRKTLIVSTGLALLSGLVVLPFASSAQAKDEAAMFSDEQKQEIESIVRAYILEHPETLKESIQSGEAKQEKLRQEQALTAIGDNISDLTGSDAPSVGNPEGDVTIVEFFDYNCGYCKHALPDIQNILKSDQNVRFVFREMPILGPTSRTAAQWARAAHKQGAYFKYHVAVMNYKGQKDEASLEKIAKDMGLDTKQMKKDAASPEIQDLLEKDMVLARKIGVNGTPAFVVGKTLIPGYVGEDGLKQAIEDERKKNDK